MYQSTIHYSPHRLTPQQIASSRTWQSSNLRCRNQLTQQAQLKRQYQWATPSNWHTSLRHWHEQAYWNPFLARSLSCCGYPSAHCAQNSLKWPNWSQYFDSTFHQTSTGGSSSQLWHFCQNYRSSRVFKCFLRLRSKARKVCFEEQ